MINESKSKGILTYYYCKLLRNKEIYTFFKVFRNDGEKIMFECFIFSNKRRRN